MFILCLNQGIRKKKRKKKKKNRWLTRQGKGTPLRTIYLSLNMLELAEPWKLLVVFSKMYFHLIFNGIFSFLTSTRRNFCGICIMFDAPLRKIAKFKNIKDTFLNCREKIRFFFAVDIFLDPVYWTPWPKTITPPPSLTNDKLICTIISYIGYHWLTLRVWDNFGRFLLL